MEMPGIGLLRGTQKTLHPVKSSEKDTFSAERKRRRQCRELLLLQFHARPAGELGRLDIVFSRANSRAKPVLQHHTVVSSVLSLVWTATRPRLVSQRREPSFQIRRSTRQEDLRCGRRVRPDEKNRTDIRPPRAAGEKGGTMAAERVRLGVEVGGEGEVWERVRAETGGCR